MPRRGAKARHKFARKEPPPEPPADGYETETGKGPYYGLYMIKCGQTYLGYWPCKRLGIEKGQEGKFTGRIQVLCDSENFIW